MQEKIITDFDKLVKLDTIFPSSKEEILDFFHKLEKKESIKDIALLQFYYVKQNSNNSYSYGLKDYLKGFKEHLKRKNSFIYKIYRKVKKTL